MDIGRNSCFALRADVAIEKFDDGILVFQAAHSTLTEINKMTYSMLRLLDGKTSLNEISQEISNTCNETQEYVLKDIIDIMHGLASTSIIKLVHSGPFILKTKNVTNEEITMNTEYLANPDVSCRIEDDDGAILYCLDTNATQIINPIGLEIWETLSSPKSKKELIEHLKQVCEAIPEDEIYNDVDEFVARLQNSGFIGEVDHNDNK